MGIMVSDINACLRLFVDTLGMEAVFDVRNQVQPAQGLSSTEKQLMNVLMLHGEGGMDLDIHQCIDPPHVLVCQCSITTLALKMLSTGNVRVYFFLFGFSRI